MNCFIFFFCFILCITSYLKFSGRPFLPQLTEAVLAELYETNGSSTSGSSKTSLPPVAALVTSSLASLREKIKSIGSRKFAEFFDSFFSSSTF